MASTTPVKRDGEAEGPSDDSSYDYSHTLVVRYSECDGQGVVFNAHYQAYCDVTLDLWLRDRMGKEWSVTIGQDFSMVVASAFTYRAPATFLDALTVRGRIARWGRTSFDVEYRGEVMRGGGSDPEGEEAAAREIFAGKMTYVVVDGNKRPTGIPPEFKAKMPRGRESGGSGGDRGGRVRSRL